MKSKTFIYIKRKIVSFLPSNIERRLYEKHFLNVYYDWKRNKQRGLTPPYVKQEIIKKYKKQFNLDVLVETGTFRGDMIYMMIPHFDLIYSIELSKELYKAATNRFKKNKKVHLIQGDSGEKLITVTALLKKQAIFWLDGHYSAGITVRGILDTPITNELSTIFKNNHNHIILIDDARDFNGTNDYPTFVQLQEAINTLSNNSYNTFIENDVIHVIPKF